MEEPLVDQSQAEVERLTYTPLEASKAAGVSRNTIYEEVNAGRLPARRVGRKILIRKSALEKWLDEGNLCNA